MTERKLTPEQIAGYGHAPGDHLRRLFATAFSLPQAEGRKKCLLRIEFPRPNARQYLAFCEKI